MKNKGKILLARHGSTALNEEGDKIRGWWNVPLSELGHKEVKELGERLKKEKLDFIVASDLGRTMETAQAVSRETGAPILISTLAFRPWNVGTYTGQKSGEVIKELNELYVVGDPDKPVPEGESFNQFKKRVLDGFKEVRKMDTGNNILIVAHHRNDVLEKAWEAMGYPEDYSIDLKIFMSKGMGPAQYRAVADIPVESRTLKGLIKP